VSPTSRRIFLYWLLLLVPTLVVGGVAIQLLRREQARLVEQGAYAQESRRAAVTARVRLIVENVELLVGDVQAGLLDTIAAQPVSGLDGFLEQWEKNNPLVRTAFRCTADGRLLRPTGDTGDRDAGGFVRRFARQLGETRPWSVPKREADGVSGKLQAPAPAAEPPERKAVASNVAQVQSARRDVQELVKTREFPSVASVGESRNRATPGRQAEGAATGAGLAAAPAMKAEPAAAASPAADRREVGAGSLGDSARTRGPGPAAVAVLLPPAKDAVPERRGWAPAVVDGRLHLLGWVQPGGGGDIRGFELELTAFISRLAGALPAEVGSGEGYALRDDQGRILHQVGAVPPTGSAAARVPLAMALLPGWDVVGHLPLAPSRSAAGAGFLWVSGLLVAIFVAAILAGGSLLLWQARRSEAEAAQKTSFVANVSHEFKTPLTTIRLFAELLEQGRVRDAAQGGEYLRTIGRETQRLARLVNNALDFSRLEQGRKKYARERLDLTAELSRLLDTHAPRLAEAGMTLRRELPAEALPVLGDRDAFEQIVLNLLDNAAKYAAAGREVTVGLTARGGGGAAVRVADRGPGVPPEHRERIFEKFHRVDDTLTAEKTGAGLGLSIARQLARGLGGSLRYAPRPGGGAEFVLELP
jgi:signal transduction histidine kinase